MHCKSRLKSRNGHIEQDVSLEHALSTFTISSRVIFAYLPVDIPNIGFKPFAPGSIFFAPSPRIHTFGACVGAVRRGIWYAAVYIAPEVVHQITNDTQIFTNGS